MGQKKTYHRVTSLYYWPEVNINVIKYVRGCYICLQTKSVHRKPAGLMDKSNIPEPGSMVASDCMGPYPRSKTGYTNILIFKDLFTKCTEIIPIRNKNAKTIVHYFERSVLCQQWTTIYFITDRGSN